MIRAVQEDEVSQTFYRDENQLGQGHGILCTIVDLHGTAETVAVAAGLPGSITHHLGSNDMLLTGICSLTFAAVVVVMLLSGACWRLPPSNVLRRSSQTSGWLRSSPHTP
jgi:hypothetical protein